MRTWSEGPSWLGTLPWQPTEDRSVNNLEGNGDDDGDQIFVYYKENGDGHYLESCEKTCSFSRSYHIS